MDKKLQFIPYCLIIFIVIFLSIGYSAFQTQMIISDAKGVVRLQDKIRITRISPRGGNSNEEQNLDGYTTYDEYDVKAIESNIILPSKYSTVTYEVEITNFGDYDMALTEINNLPSNLEIKNIDYTYGTKLCDQERCNHGNVNTIHFTIGYKSTVTEGSITTISLHLDFSFKKVFSISYSNFTDVTGLATQILEDEVKSIDFSNLSSVPSSVNVTGATLNNNDFPVIVLSGANSNVVIAATYGASEPDGSEERPYENDSSTYNTSNLEEGYTVFTEAQGTPIVYVDENNKITEFSFSDENANVPLNNNPLDTGVMAFDGGNFSVHLVFTTNFQSNTRKTFLAALVNAQNSNNKYTGFVFTVYQYYRIRIYALNNVTIGGNGYGGSNVYDFQFPTSYGNKVSKYVIDMTYTASTKTLSTVFKYGPNDGTSIENFQSLSESEAVSTFPSNLDGPTITLGGNGVVSTYNMNSMNVLEFSVTKS